MKVQVVSLHSTTSGKVFPGLKRHHTDYKSDVNGSYTIKPKYIVSVDSILTFISPTAEFVTFVLILKIKIVMLVLHTIYR